MFIKIELKSVAKRLQSNYYTDRNLFANDILKIFANARVYNLPDTIYVKASNELEGFITPYLLALKDDKHEINEEEEQEDMNESETTKTTKKIPKKKIKKDKFH